MTAEVHGRDEHVFVPCVDASGAASRVEVRETFVVWEAFVGFRVGGGEGSQLAVLQDYGGVEDL